MELRGSDFIETLNKLVSNSGMMACNVSQALADTDDRGLFDASPRRLWKRMPKCRPRRKGPSSRWSSRISSNYNSTRSKRKKSGKE
jgi:hypothetical protein